MSTRVKIGIAAAIVAALVGLIVLDQRSAGSGADKPAAGAAEPSGPGVAVESDLPASLANPVRDAMREMNTRAQQAVGASKPAPSPTPPTTASSPAEPPRPAQPPPAAETYEVKEGDLLWTIAEKKYGDGRLHELIAKANNISDPSRLRIGQKLVLPPKPSGEAAAAPVPPVTDGGQRTYVVQVGDTLAKIAERFLKNAQLAQKIFEANRNVIEHADSLMAGTKIVLPDTGSEPEAPVVTPGNAADPAGRKTYRVRPGDSLWKIAKAHANGKGVHETMKKICALNSEKLPSEGAPLHVDWVLAMPEQ